MPVEILLVRRRGYGVSALSSLGEKALHKQERKK